MLSYPDPESRRDSATMMTRFQRIALTAFICLEILIFFGAIVRATGSGLGCPDWPFCYGRLIPPVSAAQIDFSKLDLAKFQKKAAQLGEDPAAITLDQLRERFDPVETWIEYLNRASSLPLSIMVLLLVIAGWRGVEAAPSPLLGVRDASSRKAELGDEASPEPGRRRGHRHYVLRYASLAALALLLANIVIGALVVKNLLKPNNITLHMGLAMLMLCVLVFSAWRGSKQPWRLRLAQPLPWQIALVLFILVIIEGIMGSQVREMTDLLAKSHAGQSRSVWVTELEQSWVYLVHRSFSWLILGAAIGFGITAKRALGRLRWLEWSIIALVLAQMCLGIVLAHVGIVRVAQVLHIGFSSMLVSGLFLWLLGGRRAQVG